MRVLALPKLLRQLPSRQALAPCRPLALMRAVWGRSDCGDNAPREVVKFHSPASRFPTQLLEGFLRVYLVSLGENSFGLLNHDAGVQSGLQLEGALEQEPRGIIRCAQQRGQQRITPFAEANLTGI